MKARSFRIVVDARMVGLIPHGIARYVSLLSKGLALKQKVSGLEYELLFMTSTKEIAPLFEPFSSEVVDFPFLSLREIGEIPKFLKRTQASLYHSPSFSSLWNCPCPSILTIHDLNHLTYGDWSKKLYYQILLRRFASKSRALVTVSEFSRKEISHWLGISTQKIDVVSNSVEPSSESSVSGSTALKNSAFPQQEILKKFGLEPRKYFFCLSNSKPHKNLPFLIQTYLKFQMQLQGAWPLALSAQLPTQPLGGTSGVKMLGELTDREAHVLLENSAASLSPSLYEGFGLPPVEAALAGVPLVVSRIPPHEEGLQDLSPSEVLWIDPKDFHGWTQAFHKIQKGELSPPSQASRGLILERYSTKRLGQTMDQIYRRVLQNIA